MFGNPLVARNVGQIDSFGWFGISCCCCFFELNRVTALTAEERLSPKRDFLIPAAVAQKSNSVAVIFATFGGTWQRIHPMKKKIFKIRKTFVSLCNQAQEFFRALSKVILDNKFCIKYFVFLIGVKSATFLCYVDQRRRFCLKNSLRRYSYTTSLEGWKMRFQISRRDMISFLIPSRRIDHPKLLQNSGM